MILCAHSDAAYLIGFKSRSQSGSFIILLEDDPISRLNGTILTLAQRWESYDMTGYGV